eukprot:CAMPEP_0167768536 /NCGR_PEP_ID=MMETSP0110_2-20121227/16727_1 /TAXON_ID=629695 /ORGANISM="Gymnochlora sp., Strain CCMP2014" /LENGTH=456 /DNA_ID=CAMNT_0007657231 /DNA_START=104 /DNA_END=1474 /DNA_ORIENTATION=+
MIFGLPIPLIVEKFYERTPPKRYRIHITSDVGCFGILYIAFTELFTFNTFEYHLMEKSKKPSRNQRIIEAKIRQGQLPADYATTVNSNKRDSIDDQRSRRFSVGTQLTQDSKNFNARRRSSITTQYPPRQSNISGGAAAGRNSIQIRRNSAASDRTEDQKTVQTVPRIEQIAGERKKSSNEALPVIFPEEGPPEPIRARTLPPEQTVAPGDVKVDMKRYDSKNLRGDDNERVASREGEEKGGCCGVYWNPPTNHDDSVMDILATLFCIIIMLGSWFITIVLYQTLGTDVIVASFLAFGEDFIATLFSEFVFYSMIFFPVCCSLMMIAPMEQVQRGVKSSQKIFEVPQKKNDIPTNSNAKQPMYATNTNTTNGAESRATMYRSTSEPDLNQKKQLSKAMSRPHTDTRPIAPTRGSATRGSSDTSSIPAGSIARIRSQPPGAGAQGSILPAGSPAVNN